MGYNMAGGTSNMLKSGHSSASGLEEAVLKNIEAGKVRYRILEINCVLSYLSWPEWRIKNYRTYFFAFPCRQTAPLTTFTSFAETGTNGGVFHGP
jgi:hypothetical protein